MSHKSEYTMSAQELIQEVIRFRALEKQLLKERGELMQRNRELVSDLAGRDTLIAELRDGVWFALECSRDPQNALRLNTLQAHMGDLLERTPLGAFITHLDITTPRSPQRELLRSSRPRKKK